MKIVVLDADDIIGDSLRAAGEVVPVPDGYTNVRRVLRTLDQEIDGNAAELFVVGLRKLQGILQADYPQFWQALQARPGVQAAIIRELREQPNLLRRALKDSAWFVETVTARLQGAQ